MVLAVGARLCGQASSGTLTSRPPSAARPSVESVLPAITISGTARRFRCGSSSSSSGVSPEFDSASTASPRVIMPRSPWLASAGCRKNAGVPVLASVAAILRAMWPDLPMPVTTTRPLQSRHTRQAAAKRPSSRASNPSTARASMARARRAVASRLLLIGGDWRAELMTGVIISDG